MTSTFADLYPFASHYHDLGGQRMHYVDEGAGCPLVMVHGNPTWSFFYRQLICALSPSRRTLVPDHIGCGMSDKPQDYQYTLQTHIDNLTSLIDAKIPPGEKLDLLVHDWGGAIGFGYATAHPERIRRLVILNTGAFLMPHIPPRIALCRLPILGALAVRGGNVFARAATRMTTVRPLSAAVRAAYLRPYDSWATRIAVHRFVQDIPLRPGDRSYETVQRIEQKLAHFNEAKTPILIQWGMRDWCFDQTFLTRWREIYPHAEVAEYENAGHYLLEDEGEKITARVASFLADT